MKLQRRTIVDFIDTLSAIVQTVDNWKRKAQGENCYVEDFTTSAGEEVNVNTASEVVQHLGRFVMNLCCTFPKSSKQTWIRRRIFLLFRLKMSQIARKVNASFEPKYTLRFLAESV